MDFTATMRRCDTAAAALLAAASGMGHTVIVTLARKPWVEKSARQYFPEVALLLAIVAAYEHGISGSDPVSE